MNLMDLTIPEKSMWDLQKFYSNTSISNNCGIYFCEELIEYSALNLVLNSVIRNQEEMRAQFCEKEGVIKKYIVDFKSVKIRYMRLNSKEECIAYAEKIAKIPFDMLNSPMYKFVIVDIPNQSCIIALLNHMIADGWSFALLAKMFSDYCCMIREGVCIPEDVCSYNSYISREKKYLESDRHGKDKEYWNNQFDEKPDLCLIKPQKNAATVPKAKRLSKQISNIQYLKIKDSGYSPAVIFEAAFALYLSKINSDCKKVFLGMPVLNRLGPIEKKSFGMFISTTLLQIDIRKKERVNLFLQGVYKSQYELFRHTQYPYEHIQTLVRERHNLSSRLFDVLISFQNAKSNADGVTEWVGNGYSEIPVAFHIDNRDSADFYTVNIDYQIELFTEDEINMLYDRIIYIAEQLIDKQDELVENIEIITPIEKNQIFKAFNDSCVMYSKEKCLQDFFEENVNRTPEKVALVFQKQEFTYTQIDQMSNSLAHKLRESGVSNNTVVPIVSKRTWQMIVAMLGVIKAGGAYLHIDSTYPMERIQYMLDTVQAKLVLTCEYIGAIGSDCLELERFDYKYNIENIDNINTSSDLCYVIFTSGSTGNPKGLMISHRNIANFCLKDKRNVYGGIIEDSNAKILAITTTSFDMAVTETLLPLIAGLTIYLADDEQVISQAKLSELVEENSIDILETTPTKMRLYLGDKNNTQYLQKLKAIILGGESFSIDLYHELQSLTNATIFNNYGPAETTVWSTIKKMGDDNVTVGRPVSNTQIYILDSERRPCPIGVPGEIYIAGEGVGKGYINQLDLTTERYLPNPYKFYENHGNVMYRTGDLGAWTVDGEIEHLGRVDSQVKIRGLRIELGEIENAMLQFEGIELAAAADKKDTSGRQMLVGYFTAESYIDEKLLRESLQKKLPRYMVPNYFMELDRMPMTSSGKISRKDLPVPMRTSMFHEYVKPSSELQRKLAEIMEAVLSIDKIGITDDFFELGGDSLKAIELVTKAEASGMKINLQDMFVYPTVQSLSKALSEQQDRRIIYDPTIFEKYNRLLSYNSITEKVDLCEKKQAIVVLTGATGFLGCHILRELLLNEESIVYCTIRGSKDRLFETYSYYFSETEYEKFADRIKIISSDLQSDDLLQKLPQNADTVIHVAALVKHYGVYDEFYGANVKTTENLIQYAMKIQAGFFYISTISVSGNGFAETYERGDFEGELLFSEENMYIGQPLDNVYVRSKFEAECCVLDAALMGLDAHIIRVGNLTNRKQDLKFQANYKSNAFLNRMRAILELGVLPEYANAFYAEFSYVDETAKGIIAISKYASKQSVFHLYNSKHIYFSELFDILKEIGIEIQYVDEIQFKAVLNEIARNSDKSYIFDALQNDFNTEGHLDYLGNVRVSNDFTIWFLKQIGFEWSKVDMEYVEKYINYFRGLGYLKV